MCHSNKWLKGDSCWLRSKEARWLGEVEKDSVATVRFNSRRYQARVVDLLEWKPLKQHRKKRSIYSAAKKATLRMVTHEVFLPSDSKVCNCLSFFPQNNNSFPQIGR